MTVHSGALRLKTPGHGEIVDLTEGVERVVAGSEVQRGVVNVFAVGSTVAVTTMEYEPGGVADLAVGHRSSGTRPHRAARCSILIHR